MSHVLVAEATKHRGEIMGLGRPSFDEIWLEVAATIAKRATCPRLHAGAVIVDSRNQVIATGYNGATRGLPHCDEVGCDLEPETGRCKRTVHAEMNAIIQAGISRTTGATLYVTHTPCLECATMMIQAGIARIVWADSYGTGERTAARLQESGFRFEPNDACDMIFSRHEP